MNITGSASSGSDTFSTVSPNTDPNVSMNTGGESGRVASSEQLKASDGSDPILKSEISRIYYCQLADIIRSSQLSEMQELFPDNVQRWIRSVQVQDSSSDAWSTAIKSGASPFKRMNADDPAGQRLTAVIQDLADEASQPPETHFIPAAGVGVFLAAVALGYTIAHSWGT